MNPATFKANVAIGLHCEVVQESRVERFHLFAPLRVSLNSNSRKPGDLAVQPHFDH